MRKPWGVRYERMTSYGLGMTSQLTKAVADPGGSGGSMEPPKSK